MTIHKRIFPFLIATCLLVPTTLNAQDTSEEKEQKATAKVVDGKVIIVDGSGKQRVIDLSDGSVGELMIEQKVESDGKKEKRSGRAIIVGPDGKKQVVELDDLPEGKNSFSWRAGPRGRLLFGGKEGDGPRVFSFGGEGDGPRVFGFGGDEDLALSLGGSKFVIGVSCEPVGDALKVHLDIENGLVVQDVVDESPAAGAGVKQFDILVKVDGDDLGDVGQLIKAVQEAGENESALKIRALRKGDDVSFEIKPHEREATSWSFELPAGESEEKIKERLQKAFGEKGIEGMEDFRFERFGPGIIQGQLGRAGMHEEIADLKEQIKELKKMIEEMRDK